MPRQEKISYVMPAYNSQKTVGEAIESILSQTISPYEIIVVDDGSSDKTFDLAKKYPVAAIKQKNKGEASALNKGISRAKGDYIAIVESDVAIPKQWAESLLKDLGDKDVLGAGGVLEVWNKENLIARLSGLELEQRYEKIRGRFVPHITSANSLFKKTAFEIGGGYNDHLINSTFDAEFNGRLIEKGYKLILNKDVKVMHFWKETLWQYIKRQFAYAFYRPVLKNKFLYPTDKNIKTRLCIAAIIILLFVLLIFGWFVYKNIFLLYPLIIFLLLFFIVQIPGILKMYQLKKDKVVFLLPFLAFIQSVIALISYPLGIINQFLRPKT